MNQEAILKSLVVVFAAVEHAMFPPKSWGLTRGALLIATVYG